jgi:hypothetical protein
MRPMHNFGFFLVCSVLGLTILAALGAVAIMLLGPSPPTPYSERLFDTFISLTAAGFLSVLKLMQTAVIPVDGTSLQGVPSASQGVAPSPSSSLPSPRG